jgi:outer membrane protein assembly factor BamB
LPERDDGGWTEPLGLASRAPGAAETVASQPTEQWRSGLGRAAAGPPAFGDALIAVATVDRYVSVLLRESGDRAWRKRLNAPCVGSPLLAGDRIYVATGGLQGRVFALTIAGKKRWDRRIGPVSPPLALAGDLLVAATERGTVVALEARRGGTRWTRELPQAARAGVLRLADGLLVATDDSLYRLADSSGTVDARVGLPATVIGIPAWQGDTLVVATASGHIVGLDGRDLRVLWSVEAGSSFFGGPALARDTAFAVSLRGELWHVPLTHPDGARAVPLDAAVRAAPTPTRSGVLIGTLGGEIVLVRGDGAILPRGRVEGPIEQPPIVLDGMMYVIDGKGRLYAWR